MSDRNATEKPTPKRRRKARAEGQIARSAEVVSWSATLGATFLLPTMTRHAGAVLESLAGASSTAIAHPTSQGAVEVLRAGLRDVGTVMLPVALAAFVIGLLSGVVQVGRPAPVLARPKWSHLSPRSGAKRLFSARGLIEVGKSLLRLGAMMAVAEPVIKTAVTGVMTSPDLSVSGAMSTVAGGGLQILRMCALIGLAVALGDYAINRRRITRGLRMTMQEVKDEARETEGDPYIRQRRRMLARRMSRMRMMAALSQATVVVVNPTHYAVAIAYRMGEPAPRVVAKGVDEVAARIRERARELQVPIVEDPPLARALHRQCELEQSVPPTLFLATARLLAFVYRLPDLARHYPTRHHTSPEELADEAPAASALTGAAA